MLITVVQSRLARRFSSYGEKGETNGIRMID